MLRGHLNGRLPLIGACASERLDPRFIGGEFARRPGIDDVTVVENIGVVGDVQAHPHILLDQEHRDAFRPHLRNDAEHLTNDQRRQAL
jgi:hypothetical protein